MFAGRPLIDWVGLVLADLPDIDRSIVSTDDERIARAAEFVGISAPFRRPKDISGDWTSDFELLYHALNETERLDNFTYDIVVMLQPTSPLRRPKHVLDSIHMLIDSNMDSVWTISETDSKANPLKQLLLRGESLEYYEEEGKSIHARQQLKPIYHRNGLAYAFTRECLLNQKATLGKKSGGLIIPGHFVSIDTAWDISLAEFIYNHQ
jgi:CMP-N-acetylneuraminic acid synthetase